MTLALHPPHIDPWAALDLIANGEHLRAYVPPAEMPVGQQIILLRLRKRDELAIKVLASLRSMGVPEPSKADWSALFASRHIDRLPALTYLKGELQRNKGAIQLTPVTGLQAAVAVADHLAAKLGIHHIARRGPVGTHGHCVTCTCGWSTYSSAGFSGRSSAGNYAALHLKQAAEGTLPEAYRIPRFKAEVES